MSGLGLPIKNNKNKNKNQSQKNNSHNNRHKNNSNFSDNINTKKHREDYYSCNTTVLLQLLAHVLVCEPIAFMF